MSTLFDIFHNIQSSLFPWLEEKLDPLTEKEQQFVRVVSLMDLETHLMFGITAITTNCSFSEK